MRRTWWKGPARSAALLALSAAAAACGDDDGAADPCARSDEPLLEGVAIDRTLTLPGLTCPVDVVVDDRGVPHVYGATTEDVLLAEGYLMAEDRFPQMEFLRRNVLGRLSEVLGPIGGAATLEADAENRFLGFGRQGQAIYDSLDEDDPTRRVAEAFVAGVNAYIAELQAGQRTEDATLGQLPLIILYDSPNFGPWSPADVFALARFQSFSLSYDAGADIGRTLALEGAREAFPADATDPAVAARVGTYADLWSDVQARRVYTIDGFPNVDTDTGTRAIVPPAGGGGFGAPAATPARPSLDALRRARGFAERVEALRTRWFGDEFRGSNNWIVSGAHTASGKPLLANDPHLSLLSPPVWWYVHLNTRARGGDLDTIGVAFAGIPGVVLGSNRDVAWGATTTGYDVTDVYAETIDRSGGGLGTVRFDGRDVPIETITETIRVGGAPDVTIDIQVVPHHGPLLAAVPEVGGWEDTEVPHPTAPGRTQALSVRYTGHEVTNELAAFAGWWTAEDVDDVRAAHDRFRVGAQNFVFAFRNGDIWWSSEARIPQREAAACTWSVTEDGAIGGVTPLHVLPGEGGYEWTDDLSDRHVPHALNPTKGYVATANQDNVGVTDDGNICNGVDPADPDDDFYLGGDFAVGYREARITARLEALVARGGVTAEDMRALQAETRSSLGETLRDPLVAALDRAAAVRSNPGSSDDPALVALVAATDAADLDRVAAARDRLAAWSFATPHAWQATDAEVIADSIATTIFNVAVTRLPPLVFGDETARIGARPGSLEVARTLERAIIEPEALYTYDAALGDTVLWDDLETPGVRETRDERILQAFLVGLDWLEARLGADPTAWSWWKLHGVRFEILFPITSATDQLSIPPDGSELPDLLVGLRDGVPVTVDAYPRDGDFGAPDVCNFSFWAPSSFLCGSGPSQRFVAEMVGDAPDLWNALPGGQSIYPDSPHKADEADLWWRNQQPPLLFGDDAAIEAAAERRDRFERPAM